MSIDAISMCQQLGRYLGRELGDVFVEPDQGTKGTIYATPLPAKKYRNAIAVSIVPQPSSTNEPMATTQRMMLVMHAVAPSNQEAMAMLGAYAAKLWPYNRPNVPIEGDHTPGVVGVPTAAGTHSVWRIVITRQLDHPAIKPRTEEGFAAASFALEVQALRTTATVE
jgi:hypothetical protein